MSTTLSNRPPVADGARARVHQRQDLFLRCEPRVGSVTPG
jgi:hypothetical protein